MDSTFAGYIPGCAPPTGGRGADAGGGDFRKEPPDCHRRVNTVGALANPHGPGGGAVTTTGLPWPEGATGTPPRLPSSCCPQPWQGCLAQRPPSCPSSFQVWAVPTAPSPGSRRVGLPNSSISLKVCTRDHSVASDTVCAHPEGPQGRRGQLCR